MNKAGTILALGAHPDDIELGCGASLAKLAAAGRHVCAMIMTRGSQGAEDDAVRSEETERALRAPGVSEVIQHDLPDTQLHEHLNALIETISSEVERLSPVRVYTMFDGDRHQDHRAVYQASAVACRQVPEILGYETPSSYPNFLPTVFEPIGEFLDQKVAAIGAHRSQEARLYMQEEKVRAAAHFRGVQVNIEPSEGFIPYKVVLGAAGA